MPVCPREHVQSFPTPVTHQSLRCLVRPMVRRRLRLLIPQGQRHQLPPPPHSPATPRGVPPLAQKLMFSACSDVRARPALRPPYCAVFHRSLSRHTSPSTATRSSHRVTRLSWVSARDHWHESPQGYVSQERNASVVLRMLEPLRLVVWGEGVGVCLEPRGLAASHQPGIGHLLAPMRPGHQGLEEFADA
jgi:hypothetical protein